MANSEKKYKVYVVTRRDMGHVRQGIAGMHACLKLMTLNVGRAPADAHLVFLEVHDETELACFRDRVKEAQNPFAISGLKPLDIGLYRKVGCDIIEWEEPDGNSVNSGLACIVLWGPGARDHCKKLRMVGVE